MSAFRGKADTFLYSQTCPLMTRSGRFKSNKCAESRGCVIVEAHFELKGWRGTPCTDFDMLAISAFGNLAEIDADDEHVRSEGQADIVIRRRRTIVRMTTCYPRNAREFEDAVDSLMFDQRVALARAIHAEQFNDRFPRLFRNRLAARSANRTPVLDFELQPPPWLA